MHLTRRGATTLTGAMAFANGGCAIDLNGNADFGDIDSDEACRDFPE